MHILVHYSQNILTFDYTSLWSEWLRTSFNEQTINNRKAVWWIIRLVVSLSPRNVWFRSQFRTKCVQIETLSRQQLTIILLTCRIWWVPNNAGKWQMVFNSAFNPLNAKLNPICHLLVLIGVHPILHVSRIRIKALTGHFRKRHVLLN
jgi:hypothetical protein